MSVNLALGIFGVCVGTIAILAAFFLPKRKATADNPYPEFLRGNFPVVLFGYVPLLAGAIFLAAWWQETSDPTATGGRPEVVQEER